MLPHIHIGFFAIPSYSLMTLIGLIAFTVVTILILEKKEKNPQYITNRLLIISALGFAAMAAGAFVLNSFFHSIAQKTIVFGGITWLGGVLVAFPVTIVLIHKFCPYVKGEALEYFNFMIPGIVLAHGFGRIGCFLGGCCYGAQIDSIFGISFPEGSLAAHTYPAASGGSLPVLPTQLFEAVFEFVLFIILMILYKKLKNHFLEIYAIGYGIFRFSLEFLRGDDRGATGLIMTPSQLMSLILMIGGVVVILYNKNILFKKTRQKMASFKEEREAQPVYNGRTAKKLRELKSLLDDEIITQEEFESAKKELLEQFLK
ncbi:MAG: prolipoprotein diacylglyceryl transferase [Clostridia bacterium]|nr:prolipoprotein diacylglyceryl transferase [Clostridia bacterium]